MINYLLADWKDRWKYVDDTTTTETIGPDCNSNLQDLVNYIDNWTTSNNMKLRDRSLIIRQGGLEEKEQKRCKFSMTHPIKVLIFSCPPPFYPIIFFTAPPPYFFYLFFPKNCWRAGGTTRNCVRPNPLPSHDKLSSRRLEGPMEIR